MMMMMMMMMMIIICYYYYNPQFIQCYSSLSRRFSAQTVHHNKLVNNDACINTDLLLRCTICE